MRYWKCCIRIWWQFSICFASENRDNIYFPLLLLILRREFRIFDDLSNATNRISDYFSARFWSRSTRRGFASRIEEIKLVSIIRFFLWNVMLRSNFSTFAPSFFTTTFQRSREEERALLWFFWSFFSSKRILKEAKQLVVKVERYTESNIYNSCFRWIIARMLHRCVIPSWK